MIGAGIGLVVLGGPAGALFGGMTGHAVDLLYARLPDQDTRTRPSLQKTLGVSRILFHLGTAFKTWVFFRTKAAPKSRSAHGTQGKQAAQASQGQDSGELVLDLACLAAKVAKSDGRVTPAEIQVFRQSPLIQSLSRAGTDGKAIGTAFDAAKKTIRGIEPPARRIAQSLGRGSSKTMEVLDLMVQIALTEGVVASSTLKTLGVLAQCLGHSSQNLSILIEKYRPTADQAHAGRGTKSASAAAEDFKILGVGSDVDEQTLKRAYRHLARTLHPDGMVARGVDPSRVAEAEDRLAQINAAYGRILSRHGWK